MDSFKDEICQLVGSTISYKKILGNSIVLYTNGEPGDSTVKSIWIDPIWRLEDSHMYLVGSDDFPWEKKEGQTEEDLSRDFESICAKTNGLLHSKVTRISFNSTNDICIEFDNKHCLKTFVCGTEDEMWTYRNVIGNYQILGFYDRIEKIQRKEKPELGKEPEE